MSNETLWFILTALATLGILAAFTFRTAEPGEVCWTGVLQKKDDSHFALMGENNTPLLFTLAEEAVVFLNERTINIHAVKSGRRAMVMFKKIKGELLATRVDLTLLPSDLQMHRLPSQFR